MNIDKDEISQTIRIEHAEPEWFLRSVSDLRDSISPRRSKWSRFSSWLFATAVPIIILVGGYLLNAKIERDQVRQSAEKEEMQSSIERKVETFAKLMTALTKYRMVVEDCMSECNIGAPNGSDGQRNLRSINRKVLDQQYEISVVAQTAIFDFSNQVEEELENFFSWAYSNRDVCSKGAPPVHEYLSKVDAIKNTMTNEIMSAVDKLNKTFRIPKAGSGIQAGASHSLAPKNEARLK